MDRVQTVCDEVRDLLSALVDGQLSPDEKARVESHLALCPACTEELALTRRTVSALRSLPRAVVPPELATRVRAEIQRDAQRGPMGQVIQWAFPRGQGRTLLMAATLFGFALFLGVGMRVFGPRSPRGAEEEAPAPQVAASPSADAPAATTGALSQRSTDDARDKDQLLNEAQEPAATPSRIAPSPVAPSSRIPATAPAKPVAEPPAPPAAAAGSPAAADGVPFTEAGPRLEGKVSGDGVAGNAGGMADRERKAEEAPTRQETRSQSEKAKELAKRDDAEGLRREPAPAPKTAPEGQKLAALDAKKSAPVDEAAPDKSVAAAKDLGTFGRRISVPRQRYIYRVDCDSGVFEGILDEHERSRKPCSTIASLAFMPGSLATEPIMRLTFPVPPAETIATAPEAEIGPSVSGGAPAAAAPKPGEADVDSGYASRGNKGRLPDISFKVTVNSCDPTIEGGAGSDDNPVAIREGVTPPILLQGHVPQISRSLEGVSLILDVKVRRDGHVDDVKVVSGPDLPANLAAPVIRAIRLWEYEPAWCGDQPVASVFRMQMGWSRP